jgi:hypothetical protein
MLLKVTFMDCGILASSSPYVNQSSTVPIHAKHNSLTCARSELFHPTDPECAKVRVLCFFVDWYC